VRLREPAAPAAIAVAAVVALLAVYPTAMLVYGSFSDADLGQRGELTLANSASAYGDPETYRLLADSFVFAAGAAAGSLVLAVALAWITVRTNAPLRRLFELTAIVPNIFPPALLAIAWTLLASPSVGLLNAIFKSLF
jgi:iron(III) transport system permease protein